jgi:hypothetical protein
MNDIETMLSATFDFPSSVREKMNEWHPTRCESIQFGVSCASHSQKQFWSSCIEEVKTNNLQQNRKSQSFFQFNHEVEHLVYTLGSCSRCLT